MNNDSPANRIELTRSEVEALLPAHALGALEPEEALAVERYLRDHETLLVRAASLDQITAHLGYVAEPVAPSAALRQQILASVAATGATVAAESSTQSVPRPVVARPAASAAARTPVRPPVRPPAPVAAPRAVQPSLIEQPRFDFFRRLYAWRTAALVATAVALLLVVGAFSLLDRTTSLAARLRESEATLAVLEDDSQELVESSRELASINNELETTNRELTSEVNALQQGNSSLEQTVRQLRDELETRQRQFAALPNVQRAVPLARQSDEVAADGTFFVQNDNQALVVLEGLAPLSGDQTYQLWQIPGGEGAAALSIDTFAADAEDNAPTVVNVNLPATPADDTVFGVSIEPAGGSPAPGDQIILLGS